MRAREFERSLEVMSPWRASEIDQRMRGLREAGLLPVGGRGLNAPDIEPEHAAAILVSLAATERAADAAEAVRAYSAMLLVAGKRFGETPSFGESLAAILGDSADELKVEEVVVCRTWPEAVVKFRGPRRRLETAVYRPERSPPQGYGFGARVDTTLMGGLLQQIAIDLAGLNNDDAEWSNVDG